MRYETQNWELSEKAREKQISYIAKFETKNQRQLEASCSLEKRIKCESKSSAFVQ